MPSARLSWLPKWSRSRWLAVTFSGLIVVAVLLTVVVSGSSSAPIGYDVSYPQCSGSLPSNVLFGIVGVNGGIASNANPCLADQLSWARGAPGQVKPQQPALSLYIDTGDPGRRSKVWPSSGTTTTYGSCNGLLTNACSYLYGEQRASYSYRLVAALDQHTARTAPWWLDVETLESWAGTYALNIAALQGFVAGLKAAGAQGQVGIYSTAAQWRAITGLTAQTTTSTFGRQLPGWIAGTGLTLAQARENCATAGLTTAGFTGQTPTLAQYQVGNFDADLRCTGGD